MEAIEFSPYEKRLASRFQHDPKEYVFIGECEGDVCACGHLIGTAYVVQHPVSGHTLNLGSD